MPTPEEWRVSREIMRLVDAAKLRFLEGIELFKALDDKGLKKEAQDALKEQAETVISMKNRIANALANPDISIGITLASYRNYSVSDLKAELGPIVTLAEAAIVKYPNIKRVWVDSMVLRKPELVDNPANKDL